jgi:predicted RNA-binding protein associated with RNAse of E/G family
MKTAAPNAPSWFVKVLNWILYLFGYHATVHHFSVKRYSIHRRRK